MRKVLAVFVLACLLLMGHSTLFGAEPVVVSALDLHKAAASDARAAEALYLGKIVQVKGIVVSKGISKYLTPNVVLTSHEGGPELIICVLPRLDVAKLSNFEPGQTATLSGKVYRMGGERIIMKECTVPETN